MQFEAQLTVKLTQTVGLVVSDPRHIASWIVDVVNPINPIAMCSVHDDPIECDGCEAPSALFKMEILTVDTIQQV